MPAMTISGQTPRSFYRHVSENIECGHIQNIPLFTTITNNNTKSEITKVCRNLLWSSSGGQPMRLISDSFNLDFLMQMEPLNTVCTVP